MTNFAFDRDKFRELIVYIAQECADDATFGDVKLNKILFFSDAFALQQLGAPITGARYQKLPLGPAAVALLPFRRDDMVADGDVIVEERDAGPHKQTVTIAQRDPDLSEFSEDQVDLVDEVIKLFVGHTAKQVSELSHINSPGWQLVEVGEDIPLESQFISQTSPPPSVFARGRELAAKYGW